MYSEDNKGWVDDQPGGSESQEPALDGSGEELGLNDPLAKHGEEQL
jgi:hypothetical protein